MKLAIFSTKPYVKKFFNEANEQFGHEIKYFKPSLSEETVLLAEGYDGLCVFVNDEVNARVIEKLSEYGVRLIALRSAGFNNVDLEAANKHNITVARVPAYSPYSVAEHTIALLLSLNRKINRAHNRVREGNFLLDGLLGFDIHGKRAGVIGTGKIGQAVANILHGFGCKIYAYDKYQNPNCLNLGVEYVPIDELLEKSDIVTLHCPLTPETHHLINEKSIEQMKEGVYVLNTSRGALVDTSAIIDGLKSGKIGALGLDVYEEESDIFFEDLSDTVIQDDVFARLLTFPNVIITGHQGFFTKEALSNIAETTLKNVTDFEKDGKSENEVRFEEVN